jgi:hypothetical protein
LRLFPAADQLDTEHDPYAELSHPLSEFQTLFRSFGTRKSVPSLQHVLKKSIESPFLPSSFCDRVDQMDGEGDPYTELSRLVSELQTLRENFSALQSGELPQYRLFVEFLENDRRERLARLEQLRDDQLQAARVAYEAALQAHEIEYSQRVGSLGDRIQELIQLKFNILSEEMPEPVKYFQMRAHETGGPFGREFGVLAEDTTIFDDSSLLVRNPETASAHAETVSPIGELMPPEYEFRDGNLWVRGRTVHIGTRVAITIAKGSPRIGTVQAISRTGVDVATEKGQYVKIPLLALNLGIGVLEKFT